MGTETEKSRENVKERLNNLGDEWYKYYIGENKVMREKLQTEIFNIIMNNARMVSGGKVFSEDLFINGVSEFFCKDLKRFNPFLNNEKQSFFSFVRARIALRMIDCYNDDNETKRKSIKGDGKKVKRKSVSIDEVKRKFEEEGKGGNDWAKIQSENCLKDPMEVVVSDKQICELTILITKITEQLSGRWDNENKQEYFKLFATENITGAIKFSEDNAFMKKRERDILSAIKNEFLDYYMTDICRSLKKIHNCPMKKHCEVEAKSQNENQIELPFSNKLYVTYFQRVQNRKVGDSAISMQRSSFKDLLQECLERKDMS